MRIWWKWYHLKSTLCQGNSQSLKTSLRFVCTLYQVSLVTNYHILSFIAHVLISNALIQKVYWMVLGKIIFFSTFQVTNSKCWISGNFKTMRRNPNSLFTFSSYVFSFRRWLSRVFIPPLSKPWQGTSSLLPLSSFIPVLLLAILSFQVSLPLLPFPPVFRNLLMSTFTMIGVTASKWSSGCKKHNAWRYIISFYAVYCWSLEPNDFTLWLSWMFQDWDLW